MDSCTEHGHNSNNICELGDKFDGTRLEPGFENFELLIATQFGEIQSPTFTTFTLLTETETVLPGLFRVARRKDMPRGGSG